MMKQLWKQLIAAMIIVCNCLPAQTQVLITPQVPPTGLIRKEQLWNIVLVSNNDVPQDIQLQVSMRDSKTGEMILTGSSRLFTMVKGARQLQLSDLNPVQYNYSGAAAVADRSSSGLLPVGSYQLCYTLVEQSSKNIMPALEECLPVEIAPLSPPQLNMPANTDTISTLYPVFQWIPPAPLSLFTDLNYELVLVEMYKGQQAMDAVQKNAPIYQQYYIRNMVLPYPSAAKALEAGKTYAWQVIVKNGNNYTEKTETWSFTVRNAVKLPAVKASGFPRLQQGTGALYYLFEDQLKFAYNNTTSDTLASIQFYEEKSTNAPPVYKKSVKLTPGEILYRKTYSANDSSGKMNCTV